MYVSSNAMAATPTFISYTLPTVTSGSYPSITVLPNNANTVYISANGRIYVSTDGAQTWTNVTYNLSTSVFHRRVLAEEYGGSSGLVFVATNNAVYYKKNGQTTWTNYSTNLPGRRAPTDFSMYDNGTSQSLLRFATFGRAIWETPFDNLRDLSAQIAVSGDSTLTCASPTIQFKDVSVGTFNTPITYVWSFPGGTPSSSALSTQNVSYPSTGTYSITLTITDALNNTSTQTITKFIQVISCATDTVAGAAISFKDVGNYATTPVLPLGTTNTITLSAWIKIESTQPSFAGIIFTPSGTATGLNFRNGNQIGYTYNNLSSTYNYAGGPTIPTGQWVHVALVTTATNSTIYVNGVGYTNAVANSAINFNNGFTLGNDRNNSTRTMTGQMDEVCIYNRSLSQIEIRELMHLTKNHLTTDTALKAYYQCNEIGKVIYDRAGTNNGTLLGTATHDISTAPVGSGNSERQSISTAGLKTFANEGLKLTFGSGTLPNGEVCVTRLNVQPDSVPSSTSMVNAGSKYWIINNYGLNSTFTSLVNITPTGFGSISTADATVPTQYKLYRRNTGDYLSTSWTKVDSAMSAVAGVDGVLSFNGTANNSFNKQFAIIRDNYNMLNLKIYLQGYYLSNGLMQPVLMNQGVGTDPTITDTIVVELHGPLDPFNTVFATASLLKTNGADAVSLPGKFFGGSYYLVVKSRNGIETWSKFPVTIGTTTLFDFTTP